MIASRSRAISRLARNTPRLQTPSFRPRNVRFQSSTPQANNVSEAAKTGSGAVVGGVVGGAAVFVAGYLYYHFSGAKTVVNSASQAKSYVDDAFQNFKKSAEAAPEPNQAIDWLRDTVKNYAKFIPGATPFVESAFNDVDKVREKHGDEVDKIVREAYDELKEVTKKGASFEAVGQAWDVLQKALKRIADLAGDAAEDILNNHPQLKEKVGGKFEDLKKMGDEYGPEAKKQVDETWKQVQDILKAGFSMEAVKKIQALIQDKTTELKKYGEEAWQKGMEQAKPLLDKQPELKKLVEDNKAKLLQGDLGKLWEHVQKAAKSGNTDDLKSFVKEQTQKVQSSSGGGLEQLLQMIPGGGNIGEQLQQLQELSQKHGKEAEDLVKSAIEDIQGVLQKKVDEGVKLKEKAEADVKKGSK